VESELSRFEKIISAFEKYIDNQIGDIKDQNKVYFDQVAGVKGDGTDEQNRYEEIKTTLGLISHSISKQEEDFKDRQQLLREEFKSIEQAISQQI